MGKELSKKIKLYCRSRGKEQPGEGNTRKEEEGIGKQGRKDEEDMSMNREQGTVRSSSNTQHTYKSITGEA